MTILQIIQYLSKLCMF